MGLYRDEGIVLRTHKLGESDRIVSVMTRGRGKVRAVAKGVRKTRSKFGARLEPPTHVQLQLYEGRELDIITQAETIDHFRAIRDDLDRLTRAVSMLEATDQLGLEGEPNAPLYQMLVGALRALAGHSGPLVLPAFFLKALAIEGFRPVVDRCVECGASDGLVSFDLESGGTRCVADRRGPAISPEALALLNDILGGRLGSALNVDPSGVTTEVEHLATRAMEHHLERRLRSIEVLHRG
ncbi:MAG: DNA repair protein RecO [Acidimicrobiales bacterium]|nr:DNA repair protein RecO [Acidimicrobiales bacterium]